MQRQTWPLLVAVGLIVLGLVGTIVSGIVLEATGPAPGGLAPGTTGGAGAGTVVQPGGFASNGERIYHTGVGHAGVIPRTGGTMMASACVNCHAADGRGGRISMMMGLVVDVPDIRYTTLTSPSQAASGTAPGWTEEQIANAIRNGVEPSGKGLDRFMPRWDMDSTDLKDTIEYLKELSKR